MLCLGKDNTISLGGSACLGNSAISLGSSACLGTSCLGGNSAGCLDSTVCLGTNCLKGIVCPGVVLNQVVFPFFRSNLLNLLTCFSLILGNLSLPTLSVNCWHLFIVEVEVKDASFDLLSSIWLSLSPRVLLMDLTHA